MITFPLSLVSQFVKKHPELRYGQEFHQFAKLEKCTQDKEFCDKLYQADGEQAKAMIQSRIDWSN